MKPKVYVETTILSYLAARPSRQPVTAGRQVITRQWWDTERAKYNLVVSEVVEAECGRGNAESASRRRELLDDVSLFPLNETILELARLLLVPGAIPETAGPDAVHIAAAAGEGCEFLLTWNFRHIANVRIRREVERILSSMATPKRRSVHRKSFSEPKPEQDKVLREVYAARDSYAAEHGYDLDRIYSDLKGREASSDLRRSDSRPLAKA